MTPIEELTGALPAGRVVTDPDVMTRYRHDEAEWAPHADPLAVLRPHTAEEVRAMVRICAAHRVPVIARERGCRAVRTR